MKFNFKRLMAVLLSIMMVVGMMPTMVFAEDAATTYVATVNSVGYTDIQEAIKAAAPNGTVEVTADVTVDKWIMFAENLSIANGNIITLNINGLTINGNGHTLTVKSIESAGNGNRLFYDAQNLNINGLTINYTDSAANQGGIGLASGTLSGVNFVGGGYGVLPGAGDVTITGCNFKTNSTAIYYEVARDNLVVTGNTFELGENTNVILLRGTTEFTNNTIVSGRTVNVVSGSPVVTGNNFNNVRLKVYNDATATITGNTINKLEFNDETATKSTFSDNTLSDAAKAALDAVTPAPAYVAQIGETQYETLQAAVNEAQNGETIKLIADMTLTDDDIVMAGSYKVMANVDGKNITLDMNGKKITVEYAGGPHLVAVIRIADGAGLTVTGNGSIDVVGENSINVAYMFWKAGTTGYLTIENGTYHMADTADSMVYTNGHEIVTIKGGKWTLDTVNTRGNNDEPWIFNVQGAGDHSIIITGGSFNADINRQKWSNEAVVAKDHYVIEENGYWTVYEGAVAYVHEGMVTGPYYAPKDVGYATFEEAVAAAAAKNDSPVTLLKDAEITGNVVIGEGISLICGDYAVVLANANATLTAPEGLNVTTDVAGSKVVHENGTYKVAAKTYVAQIGDTGYTSIQAAVNAAQDGDTIKVIADIAMTTADCTTNEYGYSALVVVAGKSVTIDLNGKAITVNANAADLANAVNTMLLGVFCVDTNGKLTLKDSVGTGSVSVTANDAHVYSLATCYGEGGKLNIESGSYSLDVGGDGNGMIYSQYDEVVTVTGGNFHLGNVGTLSNGSPWIFNASGQNTQNIIVQGGTYNADIFHQYYIFEVKDTTEVAELLNVPVKAAKNNGDGTWTVVDAVAYVDEQHKSGNWYTQYTGYVTLEDALAAAGKYTNGDKGYTVTLVADVEVTGNVVIAEGFTLNCGEYSVVLANANATLTAAEGLNVTTDVAGFKVVYENGTYKVAAKTYVAQIGETKYESLAEAIAAAQNGDTVKLIAEIELTEGVTVPAGKTITLDLNGNTVSMSVAAAAESALITNNGTLTITGNGKLTYVSSTVSTSYSTSTIINNGTLTVESGIIENTSARGGAPYAIDNYNTLTVKGGTITATNTTAIRQVQSGSKDNTVTVTGGTISGGYAGMQVHVMSNAKKTTTKIEGGKFVGEYAFYTYFYNVTDSSNTEIEVSGGTFDGDVYLYNGNKGSTNLNVSISDGTFTGETYVYTKDADGNAVSVKSITGGTFANDVNEYCADGYVADANEDGTWTVREAHYVAQVGETKYKTLADAIAAAKAGDTITFLADINESVTINKSLTIDGANCNYTGMMTLKADTTIKNVNFDGKGYNGYAVETRGADYLTIEDCTAKNYGYGFVQLASGTALTTVKNVTISDMNYGIKIDYSNAVVIENADITAAGAAVLNSNYGTKTITIKNSDLSILGTWTRNNTTKTTYVFEGENSIDTFLIDAAIDNFKLALGATLTAPQDITVTTDVEGYEVDYADGKYTVEKVELFKLSGANIKIDSSLTMYFYIPKAKLESGVDYYAVLTKDNVNGVATVVKIPMEEWENYSSSLYRVAFDDLMAYMMNDKITVQIFDADDNAVSEVWTDSISIYAHRIYANQDDKYKTALVDMLNYGAACQVYFGYDQENLANKDLTKEQKNMASADPTLVDSRIKGENYYGSSLTCDSTLILQFYFTNINDTMTAKITYTNAYGREVIETISGSEFNKRTETITGVRVGIAAYDAQQLVTCEIYDGDTLVASASDSVESYVTRMSSTDDVYVTIMKFALSSKAALLNK